MVNIEFLDKINLATSPWAQKFVAHAIMKNIDMLLDDRYLATAQDSGA